MRNSTCYLTTFIASAKFASLSHCTSCSVTLGVSSKTRACHATHIDEVGPLARVAQSHGSGRRSDISLHVQSLVLIVGSHHSGLVLLGDHD